MRTRVARSSRLLARAAMVLTAATMGLAPAAIGQQPAKPAGAVPLARYFPRQDLVVYVEFDGLDAHRDAWTKSAAYRLLNETTTGAMLEQSIARLLDRLLASQPQLPVKGRELVALSENLLRSGFAVGINRAGGVGLPRCLALVVRGGATGAPRAAFERFLRVAEGPRNRIRMVEKPGGRKVQVLGDSPPMSLSWWAEGDDLVVSLVSPSGVDAVIAALDGREPNAIDHPTRTRRRTGRRRAPASRAGRPSLAFFSTWHALAPLPREAERWGSIGVKRVDHRWGFHGPAIQGIIGVVAPTPRTGIPALFDQPTFDVRHLPTLPGGLAGFSVLSLDANRLYDQAAAVARGWIDLAGLSRPLAEIEDALQRLTGLDLRDELLGALLGSRVKWCTPVDDPDQRADQYAGRFRARDDLRAEVDDRGRGQGSRGGGQGIGCTRQAVSTRLMPVLSAQSENGAPRRVQPGLRNEAAQGVPMWGTSFGPFADVGPLPGGYTPGGAGAGRKGGRVGSVVTGDRAPSQGSDRMSPESRRPAARRLAGRRPRPAPRSPDLVYLNINDTRQSMLPDVLVSLPNLVESGGETLSPRSLLSAIGIDFNSRSAAAAPAAEAGKDNKPVPAFDTELIPDPDAIRPLLFPSVSALAVDDQGIRFISRESFPRSTRRPPCPWRSRCWCRPRIVADRRSAAQAMNNLKQVGLAMQNYANANKHPPDRRPRKGDGKPLPELAGADPALHGARDAIQGIQARRSLGQPAQQGPGRTDAGCLRHPRQPGRAGEDLLSRVLGQGRPLRPGGSPRCFVYEDHRLDRRTRSPCRGPAPGT